MLKRDFFLMALNARCHYHRDWVNSVFAYVEETPDAWQANPYPFRVVQVDKGYGCLVPAEEGTYRVEEIVDSHNANFQPLLYWLDTFVLQPGELANYTEKEPLETTYGNMLVNHLTLVIPLGDKIPFQVGVINPETVEKKIVSDMLIDDPKDEDPDADLDDLPPSPEGKVYVREYTRMAEHFLSLVGYNTIAVQSVTRKSLTRHPDARKLRDELKEKYKDQLTDPATITKIKQALEQLDRDYLKGDPAEKFYAIDPGKYLGKVRSRLFYMFGGESPFSDGTVMTFIERSLEEGIVPKDLPVIINALRHGTHSRGSQTQLAGEATKSIYRMIGTSEIAEDDCGTTMAIPFTVQPFNRHRLIDFYEIKDGETHRLTAHSIDQRIGETIYVRTPITCKTPDRNVCSRCVGTSLSEMRVGLPAASAQTTGVFLTSFLKAFHGKELKTRSLDIKLWLR